MTDIQFAGSTWDHSRGYDPLVACSREYAQNEGVKINWSKRSLKDFGDASLTSLSRNYDLLVIDHPHIPLAVSENCLLALDELVPASELASIGKTIGEPSYSSYHYQGKQWAMPVDAATQIAVLRPDLHKRTAPQTWQEVFDMKGVGMALCPTDAMCSFLSLAAQRAQVKQMHDGLTFIDESVGVDILAFLLRLKKVCHPDGINWNPIDLLDYMSEENDVVYAPLIFGYNNYSRSGFSRHALSFHDVPTPINKHQHSYSAILGGAGFAISAYCKHPEAAAKFALWLCSEQQQKGLYFAENGQPAHIRAWSDENVNTVAGHFFSNTGKTLANAWVRPKYPWWPSFQRHVGDVVNEFLRKPGDELTVIRHLNHEYAMMIK